MTDYSYELDEVIKQNSKLVYSVCAKYSNYVDKEDLYQEGKMGLIDAYKNFDKSMGVKFSTYAYSYIIGKVSNYVRENKSIKVSKDLARLGKKINEYIDKHFEVRGYKPSIHDIALMLEVKEEKVISALQACQKIKSLDEQINDDEKKVTLFDITAVKQNVTNEQMLDLKDAFTYLSDEEKNLLIKRYYNDFTQSQIARELGVNQVYVSRMEKKALSKLKSKMT